MGKFVYTLEDCEKIWAAAGKHGTKEERIARTEKWFPYYACLADGMKGKPYVPGDTPNPFVQFLLDENILTPETSVLDIGAGMGGYSLEFGRYCRSVVALEPCMDCLTVLKDRAEQCGLDNIKTSLSTWEEYESDRQFDITFSSMCPAICDTKELLRMEAMTRKTCCLVAVTKGSYDRHRKTMMAELNITPQGGMTTEAIHYMNALYLMGRQVNVKCITTRHTAKIPVEKVLKQYPIYFHIFGVPQEKSVEYLKGYLDRHAVDGFLEDESLLRQMMIYWDVSEQCARVARK